jgi:hypothetical protein
MGKHVLVARDGSLNVWISAVSSSLEMARLSPNRIPD